MITILPSIVEGNVCNEIIESCTHGKLEEQIARKSDPHICPSNDKTKVKFITDKNSWVNKIVWDYLREINTKDFQYELSYFQPIQFASYHVSGYYGWHQDIDPDLIGESRKLTLVLVLSDSHSGGQLEFFHGETAMPDKMISDINSKGSIVIFDCHEWHRVTPVTKGTRHSLTCWTIGKSFL